MSKLQVRVFPPIMSKHKIRILLWLAIALIAPASPHAQESAALSGRVTSAEEGAMEGVLVSAQRSGSPITVTVVTDQSGSYRFPAARLAPGPYALRIRAAGYELDGGGAARPPICGCARPTISRRSSPAPNG